MTRTRREMRSAFSISERRLYGRRRPRPPLGCRSARVDSAIASSSSKQSPRAKSPRPTARGGRLVARPALGRGAFDPTRVALSSETVNDLHSLRQPHAPRTGRGPLRLLWRACRGDRRRRRRAPPAANHRHRAKTQKRRMLAGTWGSSCGAASARPRLGEVARPRTVERSSRESAAPFVQAGTPSCLRTRCGGRRRG